MSGKMTAIALVVAAIGMMIGEPVSAQTGGSPPAANAAGTVPESQLVSHYSTFAGSPANAQSLVTGLRDGTSITLVSTDPTVSSATFTPATGKLGYGNINVALSLARADLARQGIANPTPAQLAAAMNGGAVVTALGPVSLSGVLAQRAAGMGWGQIANQMGVSLGSIVSASKTDNAGKKSASATTTRTASVAASASRGKSGQSNTGGGRGGIASSEGNSAASSGRGGGGGSGGSNAGGNGGGGQGGGNSGGGNGGGGGGNGGGGGGGGGK